MKPDLSSLRTTSLPEITGSLVISHGYFNSVNDHIASWNYVAELSGDLNPSFNGLFDVLLSFLVGIPLADTSWERRDIGGIPTLFRRFEDHFIE
jgi:hypothetical protein